MTQKAVDVATSFETERLEPVYQIIESQLTKIALQVVSASVTDDDTEYLPSIAEEDEFDESGPTFGSGIAALLEFISTGNAGSCFLNAVFRHGCSVAEQIILRC